MRVASSGLRVNFRSLQDSSTPVFASFATNLLCIFPAPCDPSSGFQFSPQLPTPPRSKSKMGRSKSKAKKAAKHLAPLEKQPPTYTTPELLTQAAQHVAACEYDDAKQLCQVSVQVAQDANDIKGLTDSLEILGTVELELGELDIAREVSLGQKNFFFLPVGLPSAGLVLQGVLCEVLVTIVQLDHILEVLLVSTPRRNQATEGAPTLASEPLTRLLPIPSTSSSQSSTPAPSPIPLPPPIFTSPNFPPPRSPSPTSPTPLRFSKRSSL